MAFDPLDFLSLARTLTASTSSQAQYRTAVGRVYYCLFLLTRDRLAASVNRQRIRREGSHAAFINELKRRDLRTGNQLDALRVLRVEADYFLRASATQYADWSANWSRADIIAAAILPRIQKI